jgi:hypothetical protein
MSEWQEAGSSTDEMWDKLKPIEGLYVQKKENVGKNSSNIYVLEVGDKKVGVWGSTVIDSKMEQVPLSVIVRFESLGEATSKAGAKYNDFRVQFKVAPFKEVGADDVRREMDTEE